MNGLSKGRKLVKKSINMMRSYMIRFFFRLLVLVSVFAIYIYNKASLDFTGEHALLSPINLFWLVLLFSFAAQLSPYSSVSRGCLKQFPETFSRAENAVSELFMRSKIKKLDFGAANVAVIWILFNLIFAALYFNGIFGAPEMLLLSAAYYLCDVICIVFYCPFQKIFMKNKCCVTCRIFAWGTIMTVTPLIFVKSAYSWSLVGLAIVCTVLWEISYRRHPERFCEETNLYLTCDMCTDHLCAIKRLLECVPAAEEALCASVLEEAEQRK